MNYNLVLFEVFGGEGVQGERAPFSSEKSAPAVRQPRVSLSFPIIQPSTILSLYCLRFLGCGGCKGGEGTFSSEKSTLSPLAYMGKSIKLFPVPSLPLRPS